MKEWDDSFEKQWGFRVTLVADQWRKTQSEQRSQIGRTYPVDSVSQRDTAPAFAVASADDDPPPPAKAPSTASRSSPSSTRSSPRDQHTNVASSAQQKRRPSVAAPSSSGSAHGGSPGKQQQRQAQYVHDSMSAAPAGGRTLQPQQSLPSLKASGLLDYSKPVTDAFSQASISRTDERGGGHAHTQSLGRVNVPPPPSSSSSSSVPMGYHWMADGQHGAM